MALALVLEQVSLVGEGAWAVAAPEGPLARVGPDVARQVALHHEAPGAEAAAEGALPRVGAQVGRGTAALEEALVTLRALEGRLPAVPHAVLGQRLGLGGSVVAQGATVDPAGPRAAPARAHARLCACAERDESQSGNKCFLFRIK